jgi:hypothetical protein
MNFKGIFTNTLLTSWWKRYNGQTSSKYYQWKREITNKQNKDKKELLWKLKRRTVSVEDLVITEGYLKFHAHEF